jgi:osmotically-inducible protein OsmY
MPAHAEMLDDVRAALLSEPAIDIAHYPIALDLRGGTLTMEGELDSLAAKKLALLCAAGHSAVRGIIDRLRVMPAQAMGDGEIADHLCDALLQEPAFADFLVKGSSAGRPPLIYRQPAPSRGSIDFAVLDGVVTLNGQVPGLDDKRLAGVLAWWVPGTRDVVNGLAVTPEEADSADAVREAVRLVLEKDPWVDAALIDVQVRDATVFLAGIVGREAERSLAEHDAWFVFGVDRVVNGLAVRPTLPA